MKFRTLTLLLLLATLTAPPPAEAGLSNRLIGCIARLRKTYLVDPYVADYSNSTVVLTENVSVRERYQLGKKLGSGVSGTVYETEDPNVVLKMSHRKKGEDFSTAISPKDKALVEEELHFRTVNEQMGEIWKDPELQKRSHLWQEGTLPIVPIRKMVSSDQGVFLLKDRARGLFLGDIYKKYGNDLSKFPPEMLESLDGIFELGQAVHRRVRIAGAKKPEFSLDLKPENILWVEDPALMARIGLKKPGFAFFEFSHHNAERWLYDKAHMSFEDYKKIFADYLKFNGR